MQHQMDWLQVMHPETKMLQQHINVNVATYNRIPEYCVGTNTQILYEFGQNLLFVVLWCGHIWKKQRMNWDIHSTSQTVTNVLFHILFEWASKVTEGLASFPASHTPVVLAITSSIYTASLVSGAKTSGGGLKMFYACNNPLSFYTASSQS